MDDRMYINVRHDLHLCTVESTLMYGKMIIDVR